MSLHPMSAEWDDATPPLCRPCSARHRGVCSGLSAGQLQRLANAATERRVRAGAEIASPEAPAGSFANILSGIVKLSKLLPDGRQQIVGLHFAPDFLGRPFVPHSAVSAEAVTDVTLCTFPRGVLEGMIGESTGLGQRLYVQALNALDEARELLLALGRKTAREKLATFLLLIAGRLRPEENGAGDGGAGEIVIDLPLTRAEIADVLGLTLETVSRQFAALRRAGIIRLEGARRIVVTNRTRLKEATEE
jgi:CRP/FNR family transcriptional regulator